MRKLLPLVVVAVGVAAFLAWNVVERNGTTSVEADSPMAFAPADTPFAMGLVEPFPEDLAERWAERMDPVVPVYASQLRRAAAALDKPEAAVLARVLEGLAAELEGRSAREVLAAFGVDADSRMAFYGLGLVPVLRWELADPDALRALVARVEAHAGSALPTAQAGAQDYWIIAVPDAPVQGVAAIVDRHLVLTVAPVGADQTTLAVLFGASPPSPSLLSTDAFDALVEDYGYQRNFIGFFDTGRFLTALGSEPTALEQAFLDALGTTKPAIDPVCREEYKAIALAWPRASVGYTELDARSMQVRAVLEASPEIAQDLMTLRAPMPAADAVGEDTLASLGVSFNLGALPTVVNRRAGSIAAAPYQCEALAFLNRGAEQARAGMSNPALYAAAPAFRGFHAILEELELGPDMQPTTLAAALIIGSDNPQSLLAMAAMALPQVAQLKLQPDGSVHALEVPPMPNVPAALPAWAAMTDKLLGVAVGEGGDERLPRYMRSDADQQPLLLLGYSGRLYRMIGDVAERAAEALPAGETRDDMQQQATLMRDVYAAWIDYAEMRIEFTENGIEMLQDVRTFD